MMKMLQLILAMMMATSGCLCSALCGVSLCEHDHHVGESACSDHEHQHQDPEPDCEHPEPADRSLPEPPPSLVAPFVSVATDLVQDWPQEITESRRIRLPRVASVLPRGRTFQETFCRFLL